MKKKTSTILISLLVSLLALVFFLLSDYTPLGDWIKHEISAYLQKESIQLIVTEIEKGPDSRSVTDPKFVVYANKIGYNGVFLVATESEFEFGEIHTQGLIGSTLNVFDGFEFCPDCRSYYILSLLNPNKYKKVGNIGLDINGSEIHEGSTYVMGGCSGNPCIIDYSQKPENFKCSESRQECSLTFDSLKSRQEIIVHLVTKGYNLNTRCMVGDSYNLCKKKTVKLIIWSAGDDDEGHASININGRQIYPPTFTSDSLGLSLESLNTPQCYLFEKTTQNWKSVSC